MFRPTNKKEVEKQINQPREVKGIFGIPKATRDKFITDTLAISNLPSEFKPYEGTPEITYDTYSLLEVKKLSANLPTWLSYEIMLQGIHSKDMDVRDLTFNDFEYINIIRKISIPKISDYRIGFTCPTHGKKTMVFNVGDISFKSLEGDYPYSIQFSDGSDIEFKPLTIGNLITLLKDDKYFVKEGDSYLVDNQDTFVVDETALWAAQMSIPFDEAYQFISQLSDPYDHDALEAMDVSLNHGMEPLECICTERIGEPSAEYIAEKEAQEKYKKDVRDKKAKPGKPLTALRLYDKRPLCGIKVLKRLPGGGSLIYPFRGSSVPE